MRFNKNYLKLNYSQNDPNDYSHQSNTVVPLHFDEAIEDFLIKTRRILVIGEIDEISSTHICSQLQLLSLTKDPIYMYINSPGGCLGSGYAIVDQMLSCNCPVYTIVRGHGHSMGAIIAAFGTTGYRHATPSSCLMLHSMIIRSSSDSIDRHDEMVKYFKEDYLRKTVDLAKRLRINIKQLTELMNKAKWMTPKQAIKIGLIDRIWTPQMETAIDRKFIK
jgi:ATP-dependent Clp protease protease subunit